MVGGHTVLAAHTMVKRLGNLELTVTEGAGASHNTERSRIKSKDPCYSHGEKNEKNFPGYSNIERLQSESPVGNRNHFSLSRRGSWLRNG